MTYQNDLYVELAKIGKSLSSERRLEIMDLLVQGPKTVEKIAELTKMSVANTSRHLQVLRSGNLVERKRDGNHIYSICCATLGKISLKESVRSKRTLKKTTFMRCRLMRLITRPKAAKSN